MTSRLLAKSPSDIVILSALRTPITRARKGGLASLYPEELLNQVLKAAIIRSGVDPGIVDEVVVGTVLQTLGGQKASALAVKAAGFPLSTTVSTVNRQYRSSAQASSYGASLLRSGDVSFVVAAGVESITHDYFPHRGIPTRIYKPFEEQAPQDAENVLMPMGITSENVAEKYGITREDQDRFALASQQKAFEASESGHFQKEIIPVQSRTIEENPEDSKPIEISKDDGIRGGLTLEKLAKLTPAFTENGTTTAGNSSQVSDGASAIILTTRELAEEHNYKPIARFIGSSIAGVESHLMGIGPAVAIPKLLNRFAVTNEDVDIFELNEAFASQSVYVIKKLGLDPSKVNPYGGAIALGHPLGANGGRLIATLINDLKTQDKQLGLVSMFTSTGQGYAALIANE